MYRVQIAIVAAIGALVAVMLWQAYSIPAWQLLDVGWFHYPTVVLWVTLVLLGAHLVYLATAGGRADRVEVLLPPTPKGRLEIAAFVAIWVGYVALLVPIGFFVATTVALSLSLWLLERYRPWLVVPSSALATLVIFLLFRRALYVGVPTGPVDDWLDTLIYRFL